MSAELHIASALRLAAEDLEAAAALSSIGNRYDAYHAQQAAEKILLALLTSENIRVERKDSHRIDVLIDLLPSENPFRQSFTGLAFLTAYATTYRYPKDAGRIPAAAGEATLRPALDRLKAILRDAAAHFGADLEISRQSPARTAQPPR